MDTLYSAVSVGVRKVILTEQCKFQTTASTVLRVSAGGSKQVSNFGYYIKRNFSLILTHATEYCQDNEIYIYEGLSM
jgi:hypothetical protein